MLIKKRDNIWYNIPIEVFIQIYIHTLMCGFVAFRDFFFVTRKEVYQRKKQIKLKLNILKRENEKSKYIKTKLFNTLGFYLSGLVWALLKDGDGDDDNNDDRRIKKKKAIRVTNCCCMFARSPIIQHNEGHPIQIQCVPNVSAMN